MTSAYFSHQGVRLKWGLLHACHKVLSEKVIEYCQQKWQVFAGKLYCFDCQKLITGRSARQVAAP